MSWQDVQGHDRLIEGFRRVVRTRRLAHAYLFAGPPGVGKRLFARELARALLCEQPPAELTACGKCPSCAQIDVDAHPDFAYVCRPEESNLFPIDLMRQTCAYFALKPARGKGKVVVIDDADDLNDASANCFLKTLEEPPPGAMIILIGTSPELQLPTVLSRCQMVRFAPLPPTLVRAILERSGISDPVSLERLVRIAGGSVGLALGLSDPALWDFRKQFLQGLSKRPLDSPALAKAWLEFMEEAGKETASQRRRASLVLRLLIDWLADALAVSLGDAPRRTEAEDEPGVRHLASRLGTEALLGLLDRCLEADAQVDRFVQLALVVEALLDALSQRIAA